MSTVATADTKSAAETTFGLPPLRRWGSVKVAAERASVCTATIERWIAKGRLTAYRPPPGRRILIDLDELDRMIAASAA
jgi:excisionase family DNA binding protein